MRPGLAFVFACATLLACQSGVPIGTICTRDSDCSAPYVCRLGRCRSACAENRDCPPGSQCFLDQNALGACQLEQDRTCATSCPTGLTCLADGCVRACSGASDCPSDGACAIGSGATVGVCVDRRGDDAGTIDGGDGGIAACHGIQHACVGEGFVCALLDDATVACFGADDAAQTGSAPEGTRCGTVACRLRPARVVDATGAAITLDQMACGASHACGVTSDGRVLCWGAGSGNLRANDDDTALPYATEAYYDELGHIGWGHGAMPLAGWVTIGRAHTCVLSSESTEVRCWGSNAHGELGNGATASSDHPTPSSVLTMGLTPPLWVAAMGESTTCVRDAGNRVACVGLDDSGQLGPAIAATASVVASAVDPALGGTTLVGGDGYLCGLASTGVVQCVGANGSSELGRTTSPDRSPTNQPAAVSGNGRFDAIFGGATSSTTFALAGNDVFAWGAGTHGVTTTGGSIGAPQLLSNVSFVNEIATSGSTACAVTMLNELTCWGANEAAQLGRGAAGADDPMPATVCISLP